jgi:hypothetical protein
MKQKLICGAAMAVVLSGAPGRAVEKPAGKVEKALSAAVVAASEFDAATTYHVLNSSPNVHEANPMLGGMARTPAVFPLLGASAVAVDVVAARIRRNGHPRWARVIKFAAIGVHTFAGFHNLQVGK